MSEDKLLPNVGNIGKSHINDIVSGTKLVFNPIVHVDQSMDLILDEYQKGRGALPGHVYTYAGNIEGDVVLREISNTYPIDLFRYAEPDSFDVEQLERESAEKTLIEPGYLVSINLDENDFHAVDRHVIGYDAPMSTKLSPNQLYEVESVSPYHNSRRDHPVQNLPDGCNDIGVKLKGIDQMVSISDVTVVEKPTMRSNE
ncbi:hypothetical protein H6503_00030 [Candidatus Woesearchaeota archaeon]|nr:hypothetical protein [Candidatus Woesearchaeota archaeon]